MRTLFRLFAWSLLLSLGFICATAASAAPSDRVVPGPGDSVVLSGGGGGGPTPPGDDGSGKCNQLACDASRDGWQCEDSDGLWECKLWFDPHIGWVWGWRLIRGPCSSELVVPK
jgi:hypothetical protein